MFLVVGLGNPGPAYAGHRHNIGYRAVEAIAEQFRFSPWRRRFQGLTADGEIATHRVLLLKPETMMNLSGQSVAAATRFYHLPLEQVIVLYDELDLAPGKVRVKRGGGSAGHNGIRSMDSHIGRDYLRVRIGIGHPGDPERVSGYVLHDFAAAERPLFDKVLAALAEAAPLLIQGDLSGFMTKVAFLAPPPRPATPEET
ncbi:MAG: aminoacyl-tRNA hydrolase [Alphaproteobacteria bacterium]|nr:aminoacyl-tRNA hydrolase [Alphaproteobacteria bacterium]